jgi:hypothetical protein
VLKEKLSAQIKELDLDLKGKAVLTEAATGAYVVTPIIAAMAGAEVFAFSRTTRYGTVDEVFDFTRKMMKEAGSGLNIHLIEELTPGIIAKADIITNSGHLRPLNAEKLQYIKKGAVIPYMFEAWEVREEDVDLDFCKANGILVGATNERHSNIDVFNYLGDIALKLIFDAGLTPYKSRFILVCNNDFGAYIAKVLAKVCAGVCVADLVENRHKYPPGTHWISDFPEIKVPEEYRNADAVIFTANPFDKTWIGDKTMPINIDTLISQLSDPYILRYAGDIDTNVFDEKGVRYYPKKVGSGHMGVIPSEIGFDPIIRLQAGGLKVGEALLKGGAQYNNELLFEYL